MRMIDADKLITRLMDAELDQMQSKTGEELCQIVESMATVEQTEDAISRQAAIDAVAFGITYATGVNMETGEVSHPFAESNQELRKAIHRICELPPVPPKQRTGHWQKRTDAAGNSWYTCPACGHIAHTLSRFCPDCGLKMEEVQP